MTAENIYKFECGCEIPIVDGAPQIVFEKLDLTCSKTWDIYKAGQTQSIFQLEKYLGKKYSKELKPSNISDAANLISVIRPGCVSGDSIVMVNFGKITTNNKSFYKNITISQLFKNKKYYKKIVSINEESGSLYHNKLIDIFYTGQKECFKLKIRRYRKNTAQSNVGSDQYQLECTSDHKIFTPNGWVELQNLQIGDRIASRKFTTKSRRRSDTIANRHVKGIRSKNIDGTSYFQEICYKNYYERCCVCGWNRANLDVNHINGNRHTNNSVENLCFMCPNCHREYSLGLIEKDELTTCQVKNKLTLLDSIEWVTYEGCVSVGIKDTYDISMSTPHHNFICGNIIVHNCLQSVDDNNNSYTNIFCNRKNNNWAPSASSILDKLLEETYGINIFQETSMLICGNVAGFDGAQQMRLIKGIGKKKADVLMSLRKEFLDGCSKVGKVNNEEAIKIFDNIEASSRYAFNRCILGSQKLKRPSWTGNRFEPTIEELYKITADREYAIQTGHYSLWKKNRKIGGFGYAMSVCEDGRIRKNKIVNIQPAGIRQCYILETESGKTCEITDNHKFPTPDGDKQLKDLKVGDTVYVCGEYEKNNKRYNMSPYSLSQIYQMRKNGGGKVPHGKYKEWAENVKKLRQVNKCNICGISNPKRLEIHHVDGDRSNNHISNLEPLCVSCHKKEEYKVGRVKRGEKGYPRLTEKVKSITLGSTGMTYDITMDAPNHNYVCESNIISCNSHAVGYAITGYWTAWVKAHLPHHYICAWLRNAKKEQKPLEEIRAMISEARRLNIDVLPPSLINLPTTNFFIANDNVYFGIDSIKGCGQKGIEKLVNLNIDFTTCTWLEFLVNYSDYVNKTQLVNMIRTGCFDYYDGSRAACEYDYDQWILLTSKEKEKGREIFNQETPLTLHKLMEKLVNKVSAKRKVVIESIIDSLLNPPSSLMDSVDNIVKHEKELMGINVSCSKISKATIPEAKHSCKDIDKINPKVIILVGEISECREIKIKNGKMAGQLMASFIIADDTGQCDCVIFPKELDFYQGAIYDGNIIMIEGSKSNRGGIIINKLYEV